MNPTPHKNTSSNFYASFPNIKYVNCRGILSKSQSIRGGFCTETNSGHASSVPPPPPPPPTMSHVTTNPDFHQITIFNHPSSSFLFRQHIWVHCYLPFIRALLVDGASFTLLYCILQPVLTGVANHCPKFKIVYLF